MRSTPVPRQVLVGWFRRPSSGPISPGNGALRGEISLRSGSMNLKDDALLSVRFDLAGICSLPVRNAVQAKLCFPACMCLLADEAVRSRDERP
jgi:hypothetical protein